MKNIIPELLMGNIYKAKDDLLIGFEDGMFKKEKQTELIFKKSLTPEQTEQYNEIMLGMQDKEAYNVSQTYIKAFKVGILAGIEIGEEKDI